MSEGITFRQAIDANKGAILYYLKDKGYRSTSEITAKLRNRLDINDARKALRELKKEGLVEEKIRGVNTKYWKATNVQ